MITTRRNTDYPNGVYFANQRTKAVGDYEHCRSESMFIK
jgi:hypothetical protein